MISSSTGQVQQKLPIPKEYGFRFGACDDHCSYMRPGHLLIFSMRQNEPTLESPWEWKWVICCYDENLQSSTWFCLFPSRFERKKKKITRIHKIFGTKKYIPFSRSSIVKWQIAKPVKLILFVSWRNPKKNIKEDLLLALPEWENFSRFIGTMQTKTCDVPCVRFLF